MSRLTLTYHTPASEDIIETCKSIQWYADKHQLPVQASHCGCLIEATPGGRATDIYEDWKTARASIELI